MMKTSRLPDKKEWDKIVSDAFGSADTHVFSHSYNVRKNKMFGGITMKRRKVGNKDHNGRIALSVAAAAAAFTLVPAGIFLAGKGGAAPVPMADMDELTGTTSAEETATEEATAAELAQTEAETLTYDDIKSYGFMKPQLNYVPEGLVYNEDGPYCGKYHDDNTGGGMSYARFVTDGNAEFIHENFRWDSEEYDLEGKHVIIRYARSFNDTDEEAAHMYSRFVFVLFNDSPYLVTLHIDNSYSNEELKKVCEGMELVPCDESEFNMVIWHDTVSDTKLSPEVYNDSIYSKVDLNDAQLYQIGYTFQNSIRGENVCDITLNSARIQDNFDGITTDSCGYEADYSSFLDENGKLKKSLRTWYSSTPNGDPNGVVSSAEITKRIVVLDLTYTNNTDHEIEYGISPHMYCYEDGYFREVGDTPLIDGSDEMRDSRISRTRGGFFSFDSDKKGSKNSVMLGAGESAEVQIACEIDDDDIGYLIYGADPVCSSGTAASYYTDNPLVDLRGLDIERS